jgi:hypothetical protein
MRRSLLRVSLVAIILLCAFIVFSLPAWPQIAAFSDIGVAYSAYPPPATPAGNSELTDSEPYPAPGSLPQSSISTTEDSVVVVASSALLVDAEVYASMNNVSLEEALRRLKLQNEIGNLNAQLSENEKGTFAGLWIEHQPNYRVIVRLTQIVESIILPYVGNSHLADMIDLSPAETSLQELEESQSQITKICKKLGILCNSSINIKENFVELYVTDSTYLETTLQAAQTQLPANIQVIEVSELPKDVQSIYGGVTLKDDSGIPRCTAGFSVMDSNDVKGITTAGYCRDELYYIGTKLPWVNGTLGGDFDIQWHRGDHAFVVKNWIYDGTYGRNILFQMFRENQAVGFFVCKYGMTTGPACACIGSTTFNGVNVRVDNIVVDHGDSGGPWFLGNTAYGTTIWACELSNGDPCAIYGPVDHIYNVLNLTIFMNQIYLPLLGHN